MKQNEDGKPCVPWTYIFPKIGEIIGGSQREEDYENSVDALLKWVFLRKISGGIWTRRFGTAPHAGFGLGFERLMLFVTGMQNIRDVIPFPRTPNNCVTFKSA